MMEDNYSTILYCINKLRNDSDEQVELELQKFFSIILGKDFLNSSRKEIYDEYKLQCVEISNTILALKKMDVIQKLEYVNNNLEKASKYQYSVISALL